VIIALAKLVRHPGLGRLGTQETDTELFYVLKPVYLNIFSINTICSSFLSFPLTSDIQRPVKHNGDQIRHIWESGPQNAKFGEYTAPWRIRLQD
jgi:hypothetical protein